MRTMFLAGWALLAITALAHAQTTIIRHADGSTTYVNTNSRDTQVIHSTGGGAQYGASRSHQEVVRDHTRPGDSTQTK